METDLAELRIQLEACRAQATEQERAHKLATEELHHRARNTVALVRSVFRRTLATGKSLDEVEMHFCGRLDVLAHYMLPRSGQRGAAVDLEDIVREELRNFQFGDAPGITIKGPAVALSSEQAQSIALAVHELATNALKFGALRLEGAALSVTWRLRGGQLKLRWEETAVPVVVSAPVSAGFGQEYISQALPYQVGAITHLEVKPGGVLCTIELPLAGHLDLSS